MSDREFDNLVASVKQAGTIKRGKLQPGRTNKMDEADVRLIRKNYEKFNRQS